MKHEIQQHTLNFKIRNEKKLKTFNKLILKIQFYVHNNKNVKENTSTLFES